MLLHKCLETRPFRRLNKVDDDFLQVQNTQPPDEVHEIQRFHRLIHHLEEFAQNYMQLADKIPFTNKHKITLVPDDMRLDKYR